MADDTEDKQVESSEEPTSDASPAEIEGTDEADISPQAETDESEAPEQSDRAKSRQHDLAQKLQKSEAEKETLKEKLARYEPEPPPTADLPFLKKNVAPQGGIRELTQEEFEQEVNRRADQKVDLKVGQLEQKIARRDKRLTDIEYLESKYPELKPGNTQNKQLTKRVIDLFSEASKDNPDLSLKNFVDNLMELRETGQNEGRETASAEMARNEAEAPLTPDSPTTRKVDSEADIIKKMKSGELSAKEARKYLDSTG